MVERHLLPERKREGHSDFSRGRTGLMEHLSPRTFLLFITKDFHLFSNWKQVTHLIKKTLIISRQISQQLMQPPSKTASQLDVGIDQQGAGLWCWRGYMNETSRESRSSSSSSRIRRSSRTAEAHKPSRNGMTQQRETHVCTCVCVCVLNCNGGS